MANKSRKLQDAYIMSSIKSTMLLASAVLVDRNDFTPEMLDQFFEDCATLLDSMGEGTDKWGTVNDNLAEVLECALNRIKESEKQLEKEELVGNPLEIEEFKDAGENKECGDCHYNDGEVHAECIFCDKAAGEDMAEKNVIAEIEKQGKWLAEAGYNAYNVGVAFFAIKRALRKRGKWIPPKYDDGTSDPIEYQVRCSVCGFDIDPQTYYMGLKRFGANKYCPKCGSRNGE